MLIVTRILARRLMLSAADVAVTSPLVRWTWSGSADDKFESSLAEFRPTDRETVLEMMAGRYLLAFKLVDTHGVSPFAIVDADAEWREDLQSFSWLRHFRDARDSTERRFARTLTLDWIGRNGGFSTDVWGISLTAQRVLNWLRHFPLLLEGASPEQTQTITRALGSQVQSLKFRAPVARDPVDALMAAIALVGVALCEEGGRADLAARIGKVKRLLSTHLDADGLHRSRSGKVQLMLLTELASLRQSLDRRHEDQLSTLLPTIEAMHQALHGITLGTGDIAYFHGAGQVAHDLLVSVQSQSPAQPRRNRTMGGYGLLSSGQSVVVADSGHAPDPEFGRMAHASTLAFEFSHGTELVIGNCGPAPSNMLGNQLLFRQGIAHSAPTINAISAMTIPTSGPFAGRLMLRGSQPSVGVDDGNLSMFLSTDGWRARFGVDVERRISLIAGGKTLVGQDRFVAARSRRVSGVATMRFHLAPGSELTRSDEEEVVRIRLQSGQVWTFLWEGAEIRVEESVRQSSYFGFHRTRQIVLEAPVEDQAEIAWILTKQD